MFPNPMYINYESSLSKKRVVPKQNESISCTKNVRPHKNTYTEKFPKCYFAKKVRTPIKSSFWVKIPFLDAF